MLARLFSCFVTVTYVLARLFSCFVTVTYVLARLSIYLTLLLFFFRRPLEAVSGRTIPDMFKMSESMQGVIRGWISRRRAALEAAGGQPKPEALLDLLLTSEEYSSRNEEFGEMWASAANGSVTLIPATGGAGVAPEPG